MAYIHTPNLGYTNRIKVGDLEKISLENIDLTHADIYIEGNHIMIILNTGGRIVLEEAASFPELNIHLTPEIQISSAELINSISDSFPTIEPAAGGKNLIHMSPTLVQEVRNIGPDLTPELRLIEADNIIAAPLPSTPPQAPMPAYIIPISIEELEQDTPISNIPPSAINDPIDPNTPPVIQAPVEPEKPQLPLIEGDNGKNKLKGSKNDDEIRGYEGNDKISGKKGDDILRGGDGRDTLLGGAGDDIIYADSTDKKIHGGKGHDILNFEDGININLHNWKSHKIRKIEEIDLKNNADDVLMLDMRDVLRMNDEDTLYIRGESGDHISLSGHHEQYENVNYEETTYAHYSTERADLFIEIGLPVDVI